MGYREEIQSTSAEDQEARGEVAARVGVPEETIVCRQCEETLFDTNFEVANGRAYHVDCVREAGYGYCDECEEWVDEDYVRYYERVERELCDTCAYNTLTHWEREDEYWERCEDCGEEYDSSKEGENGYCEECRWDHVDLSDEDAERRCKECSGVYTPSHDYDWDSIIKDVSAEGIGKIKEMYRTLCRACGQESIDKLRVEHYVQPEAEGQKHLFESESEGEESADTWSEWKKEGQAAVI
jgi:hypothetical protein